MACVGSATANELNKLGITPDLMPERFQQEGLIEEFKALISSKAAYNGTKISVLYPRAKEVRPLLEEALKGMGLDVKSVICYETFCPQPNKDALEEIKRASSIDCITFTSSSTVKNFFSLCPPEIKERIKEEAKIASLGPVTKKTIEEYGLKCHIMPKTAAIKALVKEIEMSFYNSLQP